MKYFLAAATLLASIAVATAAHAETPTCFGAKATIVGTDGDDTLHGTPHADVIVAGTGDDVVYGKGGNDRICGGGDDDVLYDGPGNDRVDGGVGIDRFIAGSGDDVMLGGDTHLPAFDSISYQNSPRPVVIDLRADTATGYGHDSVQHIWIAIGSRFDDVMRGTPRTDQFRGGCGDDRMFGKGGEDHLYGDSGGRECSGPATDNDVMYGGARHDYVFGEPADHIGTDRFYGGDGTDTFYSNGGRERFYGGAGRDFFKVHRRGTSADLRIDLAAGTYTIGAQSGRVRSVRDVAGGNGNDVIYGDVNANELWGNGGIDELHGRSGDDELFGDFSGNNSSAWTDTAYGGHGSDRCEAEVEHSCEKSPPS